MSVVDTRDGFEISLDGGSPPDFTERSTDVPTPRQAPVNFADYISHRTRKVFRTQFATDFPAIDTLSVAKQTAQSRIVKNSGSHRVPLFESNSSSNAKGKVGNPDLSYKAMMTMLQSHSVRDEATSMREEMRKLNMEMEAIEKDRMDIEYDLLRIPRRVLSMDEAWDVNVVLARQRQSLSQSDIRELERKRGRCWTIQLYNNKAREALCSQLGYTAPAAASRTASPNKYRHTMRLSFHVANCREANNLCQLSLVSNYANPRNFFLIRDNGKSWGYVPPRLFRRMKKEQLSLTMLNYLAVGREGQYYAEFKSGQVWWGSTDPDCNLLLREWKVYRIAFGDYGAWIMVGKDGRVAWKNLPARLHSKLQDRLVSYPAPAEITLGSQGAYFVRYLDDSVDYCLPENISSVCEQIERDGGKITNVILGDLNRDFIIRHTEATRRTR